MAKTLNSLGVQSEIFDGEYGRRDAQCTEYPWNRELLLETAPLNAAELPEYCRRKGLYPEQIAAWRAACLAANANAAEQAREQRHQSKDDKKRIQQLEKELQRKEKALAEAAALLILRKKVQAIWGDKEDD